MRRFDFMHYSPGKRVLPQTQRLANRLAAKPVSLKMWPRPERGPHFHISAFLLPPQNMHFAMKCLKRKWAKSTKSRSGRQKASGILLKRNRKMRPARRFSSESCSRPMVFSKKMLPLGLPFTSNKNRNNDTSINSKFVLHPLPPPPASCCNPQTLWVIGRVDYPNYPAP